MPSEFPHDFSDVFDSPEVAADHIAAIETDVWQALQDGVAGGWVTSLEAEERYAAWFTNFHPRPQERHPNRHR